MLNLKSINKVDYLMLICLLFVSGNPIIYRQIWGNTAIVVIGLLLFLINYKRVFPLFSKNFSLYLAGFLIIFVVQFFNLKYVSASFILGFFIKIFIGSITFWRLGKKFATVFLDVMFWICLISFPLYALHHLNESTITATISNFTNTSSIGLYTFRPRIIDQEPILRNSGIFWEPGAFQGYINLCLFMNLNNKNRSLFNYKYKYLILVCALITTFSTTGFIVLFIIILLSLLLYYKIDKVVMFSVIVILLSISYYFYSSLYFLQDKITSQYESALMNGGEYNPGRFGALFFDLHYIEKNPLSGNGFHESTRYADHPSLIQRMKEGENLHHGNGFSNFIASAGILGIFWYLYSIYGLRRRNNVKEILVLIFIIITLLQSEPFLNFPFFLGLPFFLFNNENFVRPVLARNKTNHYRNN